MHDIVLTQSVRVAKVIMSVDWGWTPARVSKTLIVTNLDQAVRARGLVAPNAYVAGDYPQKDASKIDEILSAIGAVWGSPYVDSTVTSRAERRAS